MFVQDQIHVLLCKDMVMHILTADIFVKVKGPSREGV